MKVEIVRDETMSHMSREDIDAYAGAITEALGIHVERERVRHGLWKKYPTLDQVRTSKIKIERILHMLESGQPITDEMAKEVDSELDDIINYAVFGKRLIKGEVTGAPF